jgi:hypothetical protein
MGSKRDSIPTHFLELDGGRFDVLRGAFGAAEDFTGQSAKQSLTRSASGEGAHITSLRAPGKEGLSIPAY